MGSLTHDILGIVVSIFFFKLQQLEYLDLYVLFTQQPLLVKVIDVGKYTDTTYLLITTV